MNVGVGTLRTGIDAVSHLSSQKYEIVQMGTARHRSVTQPFCAVSVRGTCNQSIILIREFGLSLKHHLANVAGSETAPAPSIGPILWVTGLGWEDTYSTLPPPNYL
jgi:hypothetical protein